MAFYEVTREAGFESPIVGHVGDGNFHCLFAVDIDDEDEMARAHACNDQLVHLAQSMGGTCTGEHGIGIGKIAYMEAEHGDGAVDVMRAIKLALDPDNIMNPGKMVRV